MTTIPVELQDQLRLLDAWEVIEDHHLRRTLRFKDFVSALAWVNRAGAVCEAHLHHADFLLRWGSVRVEIFTHDSGGLTAADLRLAQALDDLPQEGGLQ